ncbi:hypothetical protein OBBRIDRAFT_398883 [Obba rivulosa]|uniref:Uncharacterized protein n=1 Tax=Obba rivulosa TaxID=1052685 RepID=A0A8E2AM65_9APHY|nr:hypothetical protein OBBRIDRAFT_398883 [Obba rivulosa]
MIGREHKCTIRNDKLEFIAALSKVNEYWKFVTRRVHCNGCMETGTRRLPFCDRFLRQEKGGGGSINLPNPVDLLLHCHKTTEDITGTMTSIFLYSYVIRGCPTIGRGLSVYSLEFTDHISLSLPPNLLRQCCSSKTESSPSRRHRIGFAAFYSACLLGKEVNLSVVNVVMTAGRPLRKVQRHYWLRTASSVT